MSIKTNKKIEWQPRMGLLSIGKIFKRHFMSDLSIP